MRRSVTAFALALSILAGGTLGTTGLHAQTGLRSVVPDPLGGMPVPGALPAPGAGIGGVGISGSPAMGLSPVPPGSAATAPAPGMAPGMAPGAGAARGASPSAPGASSAAVGGAARQATSSPNSPGSRDAAPADAAGGRTSAAQAPEAAARQQAQGQGPAEPSRGSADDSKPSAEPSSDAAAANQTEFQRFVAQTTGRSLPLFGYELFTRGNFTASQGAAVPASYVLGPGDEIVVQVYGAIDLTERLVVDREGRVLIPQAGPLTLSGVRLGEAEKVLAAHLRRIYRNFNLTVTMGRVRSTEVFVVGQARNPGKHVVSGLSTLINALFETGGPSANGSLRAVQLRRAGRTVATVDLYRFLAMGDSGGDEKLQPGDVIFIPPAGPRAAVLGSVNAPAVYELLPGETLAQVLALSGGLPVLAAPQKAQLERVNPARAVARYVEDFALDAAGLARPLQAGDVLTVFQISPQIVDGITLQGHVAKPMRYTHLPGMRVRDLVTDGSMLVPVSYWLRVNAGTGIPGLDRPEVNLEYATIQRLEPSRLRTVIIPFHLAKALNGVPAENLLLQPGDIVRVYGADEPTPQALDSISVTATFLRVAQRHAWRPGFTVRDAIPSGEWLREQVARAVRTSGGSLGDTYASDEVNLDYATIRRLDGQSLRSELIAFNLARALQGDPQDNLALQPGDQIAIYGPKDTLPETLNSISLRGEAIGAERRFVWRPGFAIRDVIPSADWLVTRYNYWLRDSGKELRNDLNWDYAQVLRRLPATLQTEALNFSLGGAVLQGRAEDNLPLQPGDRIELFTTRQIAVPVSKRVRMVALSGEVRVPGVYQAAPGETLSQLVQRAGGFTPQAYTFGTDFRRESIRVSQQDNLDRLVQRLEMQAQSDAQSRLQNVSTPEQQVTAQASLQADRMRMAALRALRATGRISLRLEPDKPAQLPEIALEDGDTIHVPERPAFVAAFGAVNNENVILWKPGMTVNDLIRLAGATALAELEETHVLRADGTVLGADRVATLGLFGRVGDVRDLRLMPGDTVVVPEKADRETAYTRFIRGAKDITAIFYQFGLGAAAIKTLRN